MGSPLALVLTDLLMGHLKTCGLQNFKDSEFLFYHRYVDDTFCLFHGNIVDALIFFDNINSRHPNIRFTIEKEAYHKIPFLDQQ